jgi:hypothetical protein
MKSDQNQLPPEVAREYRVKPGSPVRFVWGEFGVVDLRKATRPLLERLIDRGIGFIERVEAGQPAEDDIKPPAASGRRQPKRRAGE